MPHKRANHSARKARRFVAGENLAPGADDGFFSDMPKGAMRIIQGGKIQDDYRRKKQEQKKHQEEAAAKAREKGKAKATSDSAVNIASDLKIRPGEKLKDFNARVEQAMASDIHASFKSATRSTINARNRARRKARASGLDPDADPEALEHEEAQRKAKADKAAANEANEPTKAELRRQRQAIEQNGEIKDFAKASQVKKINDVALAPPRLTRAPRGESLQAKTRKAKLIAKITGNNEDEAEKRVRDAERARFKGRVPEKLDAANATNNGNKRKRNTDSDAVVVEANVARQRILEAEREKAISAYRHQKQKQIKQAELKRAKKASS
ncbi:hypothetical protein BCV70DRAFT_3044 [Testicularia cyperi]|uniref:Uncharacterized protein n=1 Tax=Testicularia cyperi TaxID=1882483 RepID=A0A317XZ16_9BASI|nr:hypothetical protein BCV70DRAFT_3044 [Testicularia cyperi]